MFDASWITETAIFCTSTWGRSSLISLARHNFMNWLMAGLDRLIQNYQEQAQGLPTVLTQFCKCKCPPDEQRYAGATNLLHRAVLESECIYCFYLWTSLTLFAWAPKFWLMEIKKYPHLIHFNFFSVRLFRS